MSPKMCSVDFRLETSAQLLQYDLGINKTSTILLQARKQFE